MINENEMVSKKKTVLAEMGLLLAALIWGSSFPIGKLALDYFSPLFLSSSRYLIGGIILGVVFFKNIKTTTKEELKWGFLCGAVFYIAYALQIFALQYTTPSTQSFLAATYVIMVPFLYWYVYKKRPDLYNIVAAILTLAGIYMLTVTGEAGFSKGDTITIISSFFYTLHIILIGKLVQQMNPIKLSFLQTICAGVFGIIVFILSGEDLPSRIDIKAVLILAYLIIMCTIIAYLLQVVGQKYSTETKSAIILSLESVFGTLLSVIWLNDPFTAIMGLGCVLIFTGIITAETKWSFIKRKDKTKESENKE